MKKLLLSLLVVALASFSYAQTEIALVGGLQKASVTPGFLNYPDTLRKTVSSKTGVVLGMIANIPIKGNLWFRTGILYATKGSSATQFYDTTNLYLKTKDLPASKRTQPYSVTTKLNIQYIEIPVNLLYRLPLGKSSRLTIGAGPQASVFYNGNITNTTFRVSQDSASASSLRTYVTTSENKDLPVGTATKKYRVIHFGANAFLGVDFNRVFLHLNYASDLNAFYDEDGRDFKHQTIGLSFGVFLGKRNADASSK